MSKSRITMIRKIKFAILLSFAIAATAQEQQARSIDDCMRYAVAHNHDVKTAEISSDNSRIDYNKSKAALFPTVGASLAAQYSFGRSIDPATNTYDNLKTFYNGYGLDMTWTLFAGGSIINDFKEAQAKKEMGKTALQKSRDDVAISTMDAFVSTLYYRELLKITEAKKAESLALLNQTKRMKELGLKSAVDVSQAEAQFADDDYTNTNTFSTFTTECLTLKKTMNYPVADSLQLSDSIQFSAKSNFSTAEILGFAAANNPSMRQAQLNADAAKYALRSAKGNLAPRISLSAGISSYYYSHAGVENLPFKEQIDVNFGQYIGVSMSIPLFDGLSRSSTLKKAKNSRLQAQLDYDYALYELQASVEQVVADCQSLEKEVAKMERKLNADSIAYRLAKRKYEEGLMSFIDMQQTANAWFESQANLLRSRLLLGVKQRLADYYRTNELFQQN